MNLKIRQLEIFKAVMEWSSVSRAAERLHCTQPTVSIALSNLEAEVGFALFDRSGGQLVPTTKARDLFEEVEQSLLSIARVKDRIEEMRSGGGGHLRVASHGAPSAYLLPRALTRFAADHPDVQADILIRSSYQVAQWVENRQIDVGILERPLARTASIVAHLDLPCVCIMPSSHPLAAKKVVDMSDLASHRLIGVLKGHTIDDALDRAAEGAGYRLRRNIYGYLFVTIRQLVAGGSGIAIVDITNAISGLGDGVVWRPTVPEIRYEMSVVRSPSSRSDALGDAFVAAVEATALEINSIFWETAPKV